MQAGKSWPYSFISRVRHGVFPGRKNLLHPLFSPLMETHAKAWGGVTTRERSQRESSYVSGPAIAVRSCFKLGILFWRGASLGAGRDHPAFSVESAARGGNCTIG